MMTSICVRGLRDTWNSNLRHFPAEKNNRKCNVLMGIVMVLMETIMVYWYVMDYWWDVKSYWKNAQNTLQKGIL